MRLILHFLLAFCLALAASSSEGSVEDPCLVCASDITIAVNDCQANGTSTWECVEESLGAVSDCLECVCDIIDIIGGGDGICDKK